MNEMVILAKVTLSHSLYNDFNERNQNKNQKIEHTENFAFLIASTTFGGSI